MGLIITNGSTPTIPMLMVDATDDETAETGKTLAVEVSKNGGAFASASGTVSEISDGWYFVVLTATETNTDGVLIIRATSAGCDEWRDYHQVVTSLPAAEVAKTGFRLSAIGVDDILDEAVDGDLTMRQLLAIQHAFAAGEVSDAGTVNPKFRDYSDDRNRIVYTVDSNGNRTAVTFNLEDF